MSVAIIALVAAVVAEHVTRAPARPGALVVVADRGGGRRARRAGDLAEWSAVVSGSRVAVVAERHAVGTRWCGARGGERLGVVHEVAAGAELEVVADRGGGGGDLAESAVVSGSRVAVLEVVSPSMSVWLALLSACLRGAGSRHLDRHASGSANRPIVAV